MSDAGSASSHVFNGAYENECIDHVAFPMGGLGAGMICLEGTGALSKFSLRHRPQLSTERRVFAAVSIRGSSPVARVLEGQVPKWKLRPQLPGERAGSPFATWGLPRFTQASFEARFPFGKLRLQDPRLPLAVELTGWSPFIPNDADNASLPVAGLEYRFINRSAAPVEAVFSFHSENLMMLSAATNAAGQSPSNRIVPIAGGFILEQTGTAEEPWREGRCAMWVEDEDARVNPAWFAGTTFDQSRMLWEEIAAGGCADQGLGARDNAAGASLYVPFTLAAGESRTFTLRVAWYVPRSHLYQPDFRTRIEGGREAIASHGATYEPWYARRFASLEAVKDYWQSQYRALRESTARFSAALYDSTLPPEVLEAVGANLSILKSPTVLRQADGRLWGWEGVFDDAGSCYGTSNHVWNYAQALPHLFADLERTLRETELQENLGRDGFQAIRAALPIRPIGDARLDAWDFPSAADGQLGTIVRVYREWRISGDRAWLERLWPRVQSSLDYCIETWDPRRRGLIEEPHINTYDRTLWGADSLCTSVYIAALRAAIAMGQALSADIERYSALLPKAIREMENTLYNGEYFIQKTQWRAPLHATFPSPEHDPVSGVLQRYPAMMELARAEGPPYQYGSGCLSDGILGEWLAWTSGLEESVDSNKTARHLQAVYRYNFKESLLDHADIARIDAGRFACGDDGGLVVCSWPRGERPTIPLIFSDEVWTGIEYQVASHLISLGRIEDGLRIVRACRRRYDGRVRNPFDELEAGHWYARAMASYALLQAFSGARFDAVDKVLYLTPPMSGDFRCFLSTATGYGTVGVRDGQPFIEVIEGTIPCRTIKYSPPTS